MKRQGVDLTCESCGQPFHPEYGREKTSRFCSRACYLQSRWGDAPANRCRNCDKDISDTGKRSQKFCSKPCKWEWQGANVRGPAHPRYKGKIAYGTRNRYWALLTPHHPHADSKGYVMEHRLVMEGVLGRFLLPSEVVHHVDENPRNNHPSNLRHMAKARHDALHAPALRAALKASRSAASS